MNQQQSFKQQNSNIFDDSSIVKIETSGKHQHQQFQNNINLMHSSQNFTYLPQAQAHSANSHARVHQNINKIGVFSNNDDMNEGFYKDERRNPYVLFGVAHPTVQANNKFIMQMLEKSNKHENIIQEKYIDYLELKKPFKIIKNFYIVKLGSPYYIQLESGVLNTSLNSNQTGDNQIVSSNFSSSIMEIQTQKSNNSSNYMDIEASELTSNKEQVQFNKELQFNNGFASIRLMKSLINKGFLTYYYQSILYIKELNRIVYVIIPEDNEDLLLFHVDIGKLCSFTKKKIEMKQDNSNYYVKYKKQNKKYCFSMINHLFIIDKILILYKHESNFDMLLEKIYDTIVEGKKYEKDVISKLYYNIFANDNTMELLEILFHNKLKEYQINVAMDIGDFFFGFKHPKIQTLLQIAR